RGHGLELRIAAAVAQSAGVQADRWGNRQRAGRESRRDAEHVADDAESRAARRLPNRIRLAADREDGRADARVGDLLVEPDRVERAAQVASEEHTEQRRDREPGRARERK